MRFPASAIHTIRSLNVMTARHPHDGGDEIIVEVPEGLNCTVQAEEGILQIERTDGKPQGLTVIPQVIDFSGKAPAFSVVKIQVPRARTDIKTEKRHS